MPRTDTTEVSPGAVVWSTVSVEKIVSEGRAAASLASETELASVVAATDPTDDTSDSNDPRTEVTEVFASVAWSVRSLRPSRWLAARLKLNNPMERTTARTTMAHASRLNGIFRSSVKLL